jgi:hypothetical protein
MRTHHPPALCVAEDQKLLGMLTGTAPDYRPQYVGNSPTCGWSETSVKLSGRRAGGKVTQQLDI